MENGDEGGKSGKEVREGGKRKGVREGRRRNGLGRRGKGLK